MTSNAGSERKGSSIGFGKDKGEATKDKVMKALSDFLRPEFIGRVDEVAVFNSLTVDDYRKISELLLTELKDSLSEKSIDFKWTAYVNDYLASKSEGGSRGARDLRTLIRKEIEDGIANIIIDNADSPVSAIAVEVSGDKLVLSHI